jgi:hypothetical protein
LEIARTGYVYVIADSWGFHKIGSTGDTKVRLRNLATGNASELEVVAQFKCHDSGAEKVEAAAHRLLATQHVRGEWFACDKDTAVQTVLRAWQDLYGKAYTG